jgi:uncharacterized protein (DUF885 family)
MTMRPTRRAALAAGAAFGLAACNREEARAPTLFSGFAADLARDFVADSPELATTLGLSEAQAGGRFANRLDARDGRAVEIRRTATLRRLAEAKAIPTDRLTAPDRLAHAVTLAQLERMAAGARFAFGKFQPLSGIQPYVLNQLDCAALTLPDFMDGRHAITNLQGAEDFVARLEAIAPAIDGETERARADASAGIVPPDFVLDRTAGVIDALAAEAPEAGVLANSLQRRLEGLVGSLAPPDPKAPPKAEGADLRRARQLFANSVAIVRDRIIPAWRRQRSAIAELRARATAEPGVRRLKDGEAYYAAALAIETTTQLSPKELHKIGLDRVAQISAALDIQLRSQGYTQGLVGERMAALTADPRQLYPNDEAGRAQVLADLRAMLGKIDAKVPQWFARRPTTKLEIQATPAFLEATQPGAYYQAPTLDGARPGVFTINLRDMAEQPRLDLATLVHHEAVPGHHFQIAIFQEQKDVPFIRRLMSFNAFAEGWALYAEQLADEMGVYDADPYGRLGFLRWQLWRAARLVVDTGLHDQGWSRDQAIAYMSQTTGDALGTIGTEVDRYCVWPGQACSYEIGRIRISEERERARAKLGPRFDIKGFHDAVLSAGDVPLSLLPTVVDAWAATVR